MLKNILITATFVLSFGQLNAAEMKIGVVDVQYVLSKAPQVKAIGEKVQKQFKERYDALGALQKKGAELQEKAKRDEMTLTMIQKMDIKRELQALDADFKLKQTFLQEDLNIANQQEQAKVMRKIQQAITKVATDDKFDLVLKTEAAAYATSSINISDKVIAIISNPAG
jgi:outer membrane protein